MRQQDFVVTTSKGIHSRKVFWDGKSDLPVNHPATWVLRASDDGVAAHYLPDQKTLSFSEESLENGTAFELPLTPNIQVSLKRVKPIQPAYHPAYYPKNITRPPQFFVFSGQRYLTTRYDIVGNGYRGKILGKPIWGYVRNDMGYQITAYRAGVKIRLPAIHRKTLEVGVAEFINDVDFVRATISWEEYWWRVNRIPTPEPLPLDSLEDPSIAERQSFTRFSASVCAALVVGFFALQILTKDLKYSKVEVPAAPETITLKAPKIIPHKKKPETKIAKKPEPPKPVAKIEPPKPRVEPPKLAKKPTPPKPVKVAKIPPPVQKPRLIPPKVIAQPKPIAPPKLALKPPTPVPPPVKQAPPKTSVPPPAPVAKAPPKVDTAAIQRAAAAQEKAAKQAKLAQALNFLSPSVNKKASGGVFVDEKSQKYNAGGPSAAAANAVQGKSVLNSIASNTTSEGGVINTTNSRNIASDKYAASGGRSKGLNDVQGKVSLQALYDPNAGSNLGSSLGQSGMSLSGAGQIDESAIQKVLSKHLHRFQYCYEKALLNDPTLGGSITMQWNIETSGNPGAVKVAKSQMNNAGLQTCMSRELAKIRFPQPKGGAVTVKFPFSFTASTI